MAITEDYVKRDAVWALAKTLLHLDLIDNRWHYNNDRSSCEKLYMGACHYWDI